MKRIFKEWSIWLFDARLKEYGGFNHWIAKLLGGRYDYLIIGLGDWDWKHIYHEFYYDGYHNELHIGYLRIYYGG